MFDIKTQFGIATHQPSTWRLAIDRQNDQMPQHRTQPTVNRTATGDSISAQDQFYESVTKLLFYPTTPGAVHPPERAK